MYVCMYVCMCVSNPDNTGNAGKIGNTSNVDNVSNAGKVSNDVCAPIVEIED